MKKLLTIAIVVLVCFTVLAEPVVVTNIVKIDDQTCEITTTTTTETVIQYDRAVLQTELDHIPDRKAENLKQLRDIEKREAELIETLKVFE